MTVDGRTEVTTPVLARTREELAAALAAQDASRPAGGSWAAGMAEHRAGTAGRAVVMTMGALHEGHLTLVRTARAAAEHVVVTIFVNPLQFGPGEDLDRYPRDLDGDLARLTGPGLLGPGDVVFAPTPEVMYPDGDPIVRVSAGRLGHVLETVARPGHLDGVLTVVLKLMHLVRPDVAVFGQKDAQQLAAIRRMVHDLDVPVLVREVETARATDGLALSSRNAYLSADERAHALALSRAVRAAHEAGAAPDAGPPEVRRAVGAVLADAEIDLEYAELVDPDDFEPLGDVPTGPEAVFVIAARVGATRLIDTARVQFGGSPADQSIPTTRTSEATR